MKIHLIQKIFDCLVYVNLTNERFIGSTYEKNRA